MKRLLIKSELAALLADSEERLSRAEKDQALVFRAVFACYGLTAGVPVRVDQCDGQYFLIVAEESKDEA